MVSSEAWGKSSGQMRRFVRKGKGWEPVGGEVNILLGDNGMGWGRGLHRAVGTGPQKVEGDRRAPAGIFSLGTAFGYAEEAPSGTRWAYQASTARDFFVDDSNSSEYNRWVRLRGNVKPTERWASFEYMRRKDGRYELGVVVNHNMAPTMAGKGSAIFLHVRDARSRGTAGCTVMTREQMAALIQWLDPAKQPLLIQAPKDHFGSLRFK